MIEKNNLIKKISKTAKVNIAQATAAYETVLKESPAFRRQGTKKVVSKKEVAVRAKVKPKVVKVEVIKEVPVEVVRRIEKVKKVEVIKEVPVIIEKEIIKEVEVKVEVPVEVIKEITLVKEVGVVKEKIVKKRVVDRKEAAKWQGMYEDLLKENKKLNKRIDDYKVKLKAKPKTVEVIKEIEIIKEVPVEIIKEVEVVKSIDFSTLESMMKGLNTVQVSKKVVGETRNKKEGKVVERRELKGKVKASKVAKDDLKKIEGIGPAIEKLLNAGGISTFRKLADTKASVVKKILTEAGPRFQMHDPGSWAKQSKLAADGKWEELKKLQDILDGGK